MDYFNVPGTPVQFHAYPVGTWDYWAVVWAIVPTCDDGSPAGSTVFIDVYLNGHWEGWIAYGHLDNVQVSPGQVVGVGTTLGYLKAWNNYVPMWGCYEVDDPSDVHTHIEMYNDYRFSCYINWGTGSFLYFGTDLGRIGRTIYGGIRAVC